MKELTKAEEEVMHILWRLEKAFVKDILAEFSDPKPAYNTVSTIVRILEKKAFVGFEAFGKTHQYFPLIQKDEYADFVSKNLVTNYFDGSVKKMLSFFAKKEELDAKTLDDILKQLNSK